MEGTAIFDIPTRGGHFNPKSIISGNLPKNGYVWATQWPTSSELKKNLTPH